MKVLVETRRQILTTKDLEMGNSGKRGDSWIRGGIAFSSMPVIPTCFRSGS